MVIKAGINMAYSTVLLDGLASDSAYLKITENEESWIGQSYSKIWISKLVVHATCVVLFSNL